MKKYIRISINQILVSFQYRFNAISSIFIYFLYFLTTFFLWLSVYESSNSEVIANYTKNEMLIYISISSFISYIFNFNYITRLSSLINRGTLSSMLIKPYSLITESFFYYLGEKFINILFFVSLLIFAKIIGGISFFFPTLILFIFVFLMHFYLVSLISLFSFWIIETWPLIGLFSGIFYILSGRFFPLDLLNEKLFVILKFNPFAIIGFALTKSIQSSITYTETMQYIAVTIIWCIIFRFLLIIILKKGISKYEGAGA